MDIEKKYKLAGNAIGSAGGTPIPVNDTVLNLLSYYIEEDELDFVITFMGRKAQNLAQLKESTGLPEGAILAKADAHCAAHKIDPAALTAFRLFPDMLPCTKQVQLACDFACRTPAVAPWPTSRGPTCSRRSTSGRSG